MGGRSRVARDVGGATADRGGTAPAHAGTHAHTGRSRRQRRRQTRVAATALVTDPPTAAHACPQCARRQAQNNTSTRFAAMDGGLTRRSPCCSSHRRPWRNCAHARTHARTHTQADADASADVKHAWRRLREGPSHRRQRTHALSAHDDIHPGAKQTVNTLRRDGGTHPPFAVLYWPPPTVA